MNLFLKEFLVITSLILLIDKIEAQLTLSNAAFNHRQPSQCEPINTNILEICKNVAYNETRFPNFMKQKSQEEAAADTRLYLPLIKINCSPVLKLFLCSLYAPPCVKNFTATLKPCREMCQKAKTGCESTMQRLVGFNWPEYIDCWRFPSFHGDTACITDETHYNQQQQQEQSINKYAMSPFASTATEEFLSTLNKQQSDMFFKTLSK